MIRIDTTPTNAIKVGNDYYPLNGYLIAGTYLTTGVNVTERRSGRVIAKGIPFADYVDASTGLPLGATQAATITALQTAFNAVGDSGIDVQNLDDVTLTSLGNGQILAYNASLGQWVNVNKPADPAVEDNGGTPVLASGITQAEMQSVLNVDPAGTDNSTDVSIGATATDVLKMAAGQNLGAFDAGADKLVFWDDSDSKLTYATIGTNLTMTGRTLSAAGGNFYLNRFDSTASTMASTLNAGAATIERIDTARWTGTGVYLNQQSDTPSAGNVIKRKVYYKNEFGSTDAFGTWTLIHEFADNTSYSTALAYINDTIIAGQTNGTAPASLVMTWEDTTGFTGLLNDYPGAAAAYSLRLLDTDYAGSAVRVRRASDNAEQDIGFDGNGDLDTTALATFCSGTDGFVKTWYNQAGSNDATQTTTAHQPKIYDSVTGTHTVGTHPAIEWLSSDSLSMSSVGPVSSFAVVKVNTIDSINYLLFDNPGGLVLAGTYAGINGLGVVQIAPSFVVSSITGEDTSRHLGVWNYSGSQYQVAKDGGALTGLSNTNKLNFTSIGRQISSGARLFSSVQEIILYGSDQSSNRTGIESNINTFYSIY